MTGRESDMPYATTNDGVRLYFEETGSGRPLILVHEFAGDLRSFEPQMRHFGKRYRAIAFNARGFPPSDVPEHVSSYSQARAADDILAVLDHIDEPSAHIVGLSMGGFATLHFGLPAPRLHPAFGELIRHLNAGGKDRKYQLSVANALWGQKGYTFLPDFLRLTQDVYQGGLKEVDFAKAEEALVGIPQGDDPAKSEGNLDTALGYYRRITQDYPKSFLAKAAQAPIDSLDSEKNRADAEKFYQEMRNLVAEAPKK